MGNYTVTRKKDGFLEDKGNFIHIFVTRDGQTPSIRVDINIRKSDIVGYCNHFTGGDDGGSINLFLSDRLSGLVLASCNSEINYNDEFKSINITYTFPKEEEQYWSDLEVLDKI